MPELPWLCGGWLVLGPGLAVRRLAGAGAWAGYASQLSCFLLFLQVCWELAQARALGLLTCGG